MGQTLTHGIYLPDEGERNCYNGLAANWTILDGAVGTVAEHTTQIAGKAPAVHTHTKADITDFPVYGTTAGTICEGNDSRLSDARTPVAHTHTKSDVTDLLNSNFIPSSDANYTLGSSDLKWKHIWAGGYKAKSINIDFTDSTTTGSAQSWWIDTMEKNGTGFFGVGSIRSHSAGLNEEHFRIKNAGGKWADLYIQLGDNNQFTIGTSTHSDVTNNGFRGKFTPLDSFIPNANNSYDLGSSSYQWNNLYAQSYYYNGVAWGLDKENVWSSSNRFTKSINLGSITSYTDCSLGFTGLYNVLFFNTRGSTNIPSYGTYLYYGYSNASSDRGAIIRMVRTTDKRGGTNDGYIPDTSFNLYKISPEKLFIDFMEAVKVINDGSENSLKPITNNATDLGTSNNKWKSFNGVNPGALSLPDMSATGVDISSYIVYPTGETSLNLSGGSNKYTASENGWIVIVKAVTACRYIKTVINSRLGAVTVPAASMSGSVYHCQPVPAGQTVSIVLDCDSAPGLYFYPCLGNV